MQAFRSIQAVLTLLCGITLILSFFPIWPGMAYLSIAFGSYFALKACWEAVLERVLDVNFLMLFAAIGAVAVGHPEDAAALLFLFSLSSTLEAMAMAKTRSAIEGLIRLRPSKAIRVEATGDREVLVEDLQVGDEVRVLAFEQVPADGTLLTESAKLDESAMTGESVAVDKVTGDGLLAGTQNLENMVLLRVSATVEDSTLQRIVKLVGEAQDNKASGERISQWFGQKYTLFVMLAFAASWVIRGWLLGGFMLGLYPSLILLVALSPCALVISTPATTLSALAFAARRGILVRGGNFIEIAGRADAFAIDKTGTLTEGKPRLAEVRCCGSCGWKAGEEMSEAVREIVATAAAVETFSTHPIAQAIVSAATLNKITLPTAEEIVTEPGLGMLARVGKTAVKLGQRKFFTDSLPDGFDAEVEALQSQGMTTVVLQAGTTTAVLGMMDLPRPNAAGFVSSLRAAGIKRIVMLTGDHLRTAEAIGKLVGVDEIHAGVMPAEKEEFVRKMSSENTVVMLGDGVNDAPALARAHLGIAMGGLGSEVAMQAADVVLVQDRIERIPELLRLGGRTNRTIKANLIFGSLMIVSLAAFSFLWPVLWGKDMPLPLAVIGHEGSTVLVILNGLRLLRSE